MVKVKSVALIDTIQVTVSQCNIKDLEIFKERLVAFNYLRELSIIEHEDIKAYTFIINVHRLHNYNCIIHLVKFKKVIYDIMNCLELENIENFQLNRVDIAIDIDLDFKENVKLLLFLFDLVTVEENKSSTWITLSKNNLKKNTINLKRRDLDICFYDKADESNNKHVYGTRLEFRFKRLQDNDFKKHINKLINKLINIEKNIELVEKQQVELLFELWNEERKQIQSFSEFVRKYKDYIYTRNILKVLYEESGHVGSFTNWFREFKRANHIGFTLNTKKDILTYKNIIIKAIKRYRNS